MQRSNNKRRRLGQSKRYTTWGTACRSEIYSNWLKEKLNTFEKEGKTKDDVSKWKKECSLKEFRTDIFSKLPKEEKLKIKDRIMKEEKEAENGITEKDTKYNQCLSDIQFSMSYLESEGYMCTFSCFKPGVDDYTFLSYPSKNKIPKSVINKEYSNYLSICNLKTQYFALKSAGIDEDGFNRVYKRRINKPAPITSTSLLQTNERTDNNTKNSINSDNSCNDASPLHENTSSNNNITKIKNWKL